ncbi:hypothetical protein [Stutzerimonas nosocomialis]|nr:hypothetical protein [Stutzerimonas nosocomialis]
MKRITPWVLAIAVVSSAAVHASPDESGRRLQAPYPTWLTTHQG